MQQLFRVIDTYNNRDVTDDKDFYWAINNELNLIWLNPYGELDVGEEIPPDYYQVQFNKDALREMLAKLEG